MWELLILAHISSSMPISRHIFLLSLCIYHYIYISVYFYIYIFVCLSLSLSLSIHPCIPVYAYLPLHIRIYEENLDPKSTSRCPTYCNPHDRGPVRRPLFRTPPYTFPFFSGARQLSWDVRKGPRGEQRLYSAAQIPSGAFFGWVLSH